MSTFPNVKKIKGSSAKMMILVVVLFVFNKMMDLLLLGFKLTSNKFCFLTRESAPRLKSM